MNFQFSKASYIIYQPAIVENEMYIFIEYTSTLYFYLNIYTRIPIANYLNIS